MLILNRKTNESVCLGNDIRVTVLGMSGQSVRLGFQAPRDLPIHREEVYERMLLERGKSAAAKSGR